MNPNREEIKNLLALKLVPGIGDLLIKNLIAYCGGASKVFAMPLSKLCAIPEIGAKKAAAVLDSKLPQRVAQELDFIDKHELRVFAYTDADYPPLLRHCADSPVLLYAKGNFDSTRDRMLAIVGTRNATEYGKQITKTIAEDLKAANVTVVSGLAYGIDIHAHRGALKAGLPTIAVLGHGLDLLYPAAHKKTAEEMIYAGGGLITEFMSDTKMMPEYFPRRNRIIAGMAAATLVIEASEKGGALITAECAHSYNRDVFAIPGNIGNMFSQGCNKLIKQNKAMLVESAADILQAMNWDTPAESKATKAIQQKLVLELTKEEQTAIDVLTANGRMPIDLLSERSGITPGRLSALLLQMELNGLVKSLPGKMFESV